MDKQNGPGGPLYRSRKAATEYHKTADFDRTKGKGLLTALVDGSWYEHGMSDEYAAYLKELIDLIPDEDKRDGRILVDQMLKWAQLNYKTFKRLRRLIVLEAEDEARIVYGKADDGHLVPKGYRPLGRDEVYTIAKQRKWDLSTCESFRQNNDLWAPLIRAIMMQRPIVCRIIRLRDSKVDEIDIAAKWLAVMPEEHFEASSIAEARLLCNKMLPTDKSGWQ